MSLSPKQFADSTPMYHGMGTKPDGDLLFPARTLGRNPDFNASDPSKVYATPNKGMAWEYAEHKGSAALARLNPQMREATLNGKLAWSTDAAAPARNYSTPAPHVAEVKLAGDVDLDPNFAVHDAPVEKQRAFRGDLGEIVNVETIPPGAQTSMLPNPIHGGRYSREPADTKKRVPFPAAPVSPEQFDHPKLFGDEVGRDPLDQVFDKLTHL